LPEEVFLSVLEQLKNYDRYITFSRYNEPFAYPDLLKKRIEQTREILPNAKIICNTNGDYPLMGIDEMLDGVTVMDYDGKFEEFVDGNFRVMKLKNYCNRGGSLEGGRIRRAPCLDPQFFIGIDYNGSVMPCCNMRSDYKLHRPFILGNVKKDSLLDILYSKKARDLRSRLEIGDFPDPCKFCDRKPQRFLKENPDIGDDMNDDSY
jgi:radical SAM protein with 4Fe4S-binding SPASM domain